MFFKQKSYLSKSFANLSKLNLSGNKKLLGSIATILITLFIIGLKQGQKLQSLELLVYDKLVRASSKNDLDERLLLVEITDADIKNQDRWPLSDETVANLLKNLQKHQPAVIGLDIYRDISHPPGKSALEGELKKANVVTIQYLGTQDNYIAAPAEVSPEQIGFNDVVLDRDSKLRRNLMYARLGEEELYSFALRLSLRYLRNNPDRVANNDYKITADNNFLYLGDVALPRLKANSGAYRLEPSEALGWQMLLKYKSPNIAKKVTLTDILDGKVDPNSIKNKIIIIGTTASSINDYFFTPYGGDKTDMPGAIAHAQMVNQIVTLALGESQPFWFFPEGVEFIWIGAWALVGAAIAFRWDNPLKVIIVGISSAIGLWSICWLSFIAGGWIPFVSPVLTLGATIGVLLLQRILHTYFYDPLTALPNLTLFNKKLDKLQQQNRHPESSQSIMVLCIDLDRFKTINDALGYEAGDYLLVTTASRLKNILEKDTIFARVGGDEFAIAKIIDNESESLEFVNKLQQSLNIPFDIKGLKTSSNITTGIAFQDLKQNFDSQNILRSSRTAMYRAKASGKISHRVFASNMHENALKRLQLEADLYEAIEQSEFELYYQPIVDLKTEKIAGFESLIRWNSPKRGFVSPGKFIPIAEETGSIIPLGEWVLKEACNQMSRWHKKFPATSDLFISVNLSGKQFAQPDLVTMVKTILEDSKIDSNCLKLEITESMVMENVNEAIIILDNLKKLGIYLSMDDFGTGFSSFSYLHRFPMNTLKVDRSFVSNMSYSKKNFEIVSTIILLAHKLEMDVVAEGIEIDIEKIALKELGCEYGQGYFFAKPLSVQKVEKLLEDV